MTTFGEIRDMVRRDLDESTSIAWTDSELGEWINEAMQDIARRTETIQLTATIPVLANTVEVSAIPDDFAKLDRLEWRMTDGRSFALEVRNYNDMDAVWSTARDIAVGRPQYAAVRGTGQHFVITLFPAPREDGVLGMHYCAIPRPLDVDGSDDAVEIEIPRGWEDLVVAYAEYRALRRDRNPAWQEAMSLYENKIGEMTFRTELPHREHGMMHNLGIFDDPYGYSGYGY